MSEPKVALIHDYLTEFGGAERVLQAIYEIFPEASVFTATFEPSMLPNGFSSWKVSTTKTQNFPFSKKLRKQMTFLYPFLFESFDLKEFDVVISSSSAWGKGVITGPKQLHICYCHTPPRFLYKYTGESDKRNAWYYKPVVSYIDSFLRVWDYFAGKRPDYFVANSKTTAERIKKFYRRDSFILNPPAKTVTSLILSEGAQMFDTNYFLIVSRLVPYKNIDVVIEAFNVLGMPLRIVGTGKDEGRLKRLARGDIAFMGQLNEHDLSLLYQNCKGVIFPVKDEDFGIVPIEAMSHGKPVLAHKSGGVAETIEDGKTGMFFEDLSVNGVVDAVKKFDASIYGNVFNPTLIREGVKKYDEAVFKESFKNFVMTKWQEKIQSPYAGTS